MAWHGNGQWAMADERGRDKETHAAWCRKWRVLGGGDLEARAVSAVTGTSTLVISRSLRYLWLLDFKRALLGQPNNVSESVDQVKTGER